MKCVKNKVCKQFFFSVSFLGSLPVFFLFTLLLFLFDSSWFFLSLLLLLVLTTAVVYLIKWWFPTKRPDHGRKKPTYFWQKVDQGSFPSAHAARASALVVIAFYFPYVWLQVVSVCFLVLVSVARVVLQRHYWKDIVGGAIIGTALGFAAWFLMEPVSALFVW